MSRGRDFAKENGLVYFETSALQGTTRDPSTCAMELRPAMSIPSRGRGLATFPDGAQT